MVLIIISPENKGLVYDYFRYVALYDPSFDENNRVKISEEEFQSLKNYFPQIEFVKE